MTGTVCTFTNARIHTCTYACRNTHTHTPTHIHTYTHTSGNSLTDGSYRAGEDTVPTVNPPSGATGRGGQGVKKPTRGGARATLKATTNTSTVKGRAGGRGRGPTGGKDASTSDDSGGSVFLHVHAHTYADTHTSGNLLTDAIYCTCRGGDCSYCEACIWRHSLSRPRGYEAHTW